MVSGIRTSSGFEERIRFTELEIVDRDAIDTGVLHTTPEGNYINGWDVNLAGVRTVSVKRNIRYHKHAVGLNASYSLNNRLLTVLRNFCSVLRRRASRNTLSDVAMVTLAASIRDYGLSCQERFSSRCPKRTNPALPRQTFLAVSQEVATIPMRIQYPLRRPTELQHLHLRPMVQQTPKRGYQSEASWATEGQVRLLLQRGGHRDRRQTEHHIVLSRETMRFCGERVKEYR